MDNATITYCFSMVYLIMLPYLYCRWTRTGRLPIFHLSQEPKTPSGVKLFVHAPSPAGDYLYVNQIIFTRFTGEDRNTRTVTSFMPNGAHGWNKIITAWEIVFFKIEQWFYNGKSEFMHPRPHETRVTVSLRYCPEYDESHDHEISQTIDIEVPRYSNLTIE